jgi:hypothetical protein
VGCGGFCGGFVVGLIEWVAVMICGGLRWV